MIENHSSSPVTNKTSPRTFGLVMAGFFLMFSLVPLISRNQILVWSGVLAILFFSISILKPELLGPLNRGWFLLGQLLHKIVSPVVLGMMYFLVLTPYGLTMRLFRDPLNLKSNKSRQTHWQKRDPPGPLAESMIDQF